MRPYARHILIACAAAALVTVILNAGSLSRMFQGELTTPHLNDHAVDERLYFSIIAKVGMGAPLLGHASYKEHRADASSVSLAPVVQGLLMRWLRLSLPATLLIGDLLFPFFFVLLLALGLQARFGASMLLAAATAVIIGSDVGIYWLRASNPQLPLVFVAAWFAAAFALSVSSPRAALLRGAIVGALSWMHVVFASFFVIADGVLLLADAAQRRSRRSFVVGALTYAAGLGVLLLPRLLLSIPPDIQADTLPRLGVIGTRIPASPKLQLLLLATLIALLGFRRLMGKTFSEGAWRCFLLIIASLIALNQSLIHGIDATFVSYYAPIIRIVLIVTVIIIVMDAIRNEQRKTLMLLAGAAVALIGLGSEVSQQAIRQTASAQQYESSDIPSVLAWLNEQSGPLVIAAPRELNERIPYETPHYVLFNEYGWNQPSTDRELAERYALQVNLIPSSVSKDSSYTIVFGGHGGLLAAKRRTFCRMKRSLLRTDDPCDITARSLIRHQELLPVVDNADVDVMKTMEQFHVDIVITEKGSDLPTILRNWCKKEKTFANYIAWSCGSE